MGGVRHDRRVSDTAPEREAQPARHRSESSPEDELPTFPHKPFLRTGYDRRAVDEFVTKVGLAIHNERQTSVSADDVARATFPGRRFGPGYRMREVDDYLGVAEALLLIRATARGFGPDLGSADP